MNETNRNLYIPLYGKALVSRKKIILRDITAEAIWDKCPLKMSRREKSRWKVYFAAMQTRIIDDWTEAQVKADPDAVVINAGCGLDSRVYRIHGVESCFYDADLPEVIEERRKFFYLEGEKYKMLSAPLSDTAWLDEIKGSRAIAVIENFSAYSENEAQRRLVEALGRRFSSIKLLSGAEIQNVGGIEYIKEHETAPTRLINELSGAERVIFEKICVRSPLERKYRLYEYEKK